MKNLVKLLLCTTLILSACQEQVIENRSEVKSDRSTTTSSSKDDATIDKEFIISSEGIGLAKLGMTLGELKKISGSDTEFKVESPFMVDIDAHRYADLCEIAVSKSGKVQYYILYLASTPLTDKDPITYLMTKNPNYQTVEGVKVGTTIKQAEAIYGNAVLSYNINNESREYVNFGDSSANNIDFRPNLINNGFAGIYPETSGEYLETEKYHDDAAIASIEVSCAPVNCPQSHVSVH